ncbi:Hypothetical predicted protein [Marmota monax]|uniref:Uncharacterized protein n=1 Tax=Marmota monax TaxID=9995 RepID=A0A5E4ACY3_MARMO|nr:Hypothetical predicted protein [Marmota monax]
MPCSTHSSRNREETTGERWSPGELSLEAFQSQFGLGESWPEVMETGSFTPKAVRSGRSPPALDPWKVQSLLTILTQLMASPMVTRRSSPGEVFGKQAGPGPTTPSVNDSADPCILYDSWHRGYPKEPVSSFNCRGLQEPRTRENGFEDDTADTGIRSYCWSRRLAVTNCGMYEPSRCHWNMTRGGEWKMEPWWALAHPPRKEAAFAVSQIPVGSDKEAFEDKQIQN